MALILVGNPHTATPKLFETNPQLLTRMPKAPKHVPSSVYSPSRRISEWNRIQLCTRAGGRCEFDGCNRYLFEHHVTFEQGNFSQFAHMVAFSVDGPRGFEERPDDIHSLENLMLLCPGCHKLIDDEPAKYSLEVLEAHKKAHEDQIFHLTGLRPEMRSTFLVVKSRVRNQVVEIPFDHILAAMAPRHPYSKTGYVIDLTTFPHGERFTSAACEAIDDHIKTFLSPAGEVIRSKHVSLFALAPIPILIYLGYRLGNKVPLDLFQRHRDTEHWRWKDAQVPVEYSFRQLRQGTDATRIVLLMALSGPITLGQLPHECDSGYSVYEITPSNAPADPTLIKSRVDLENFRLHYQHVIAALARKHPGLKEITVLPAVPAPVAVLCGRELLPRIHPSLRVYDHDRDIGYHFELTVNP